MGTYDSILQHLKESRGSSDYEQKLGMLRDSFGEIVRDFCSVRQYVMDIATLPDASVKDIACGSPPFVIEDGETSYAVIWPDGVVKPLPVGFEVAEAELNVDDDTILMNTLAPRTPSGLIRYVPIKEEFEMPNDDAFELERLCRDWEQSNYELDGLDFRENRYFDKGTGEPYTGKATAYWPNGVQRKEAILSDGFLTGKMTWWYESGQKELEDYYVDNLRHGMHRTWHENGERWAEGEFVNGKKQGLHRWWHSNGSSAEECSYEDDLAQGSTKKWHENGMLALQSNFESGVEEGIHKEWSESGAKQIEVPVVSGEFHGLAHIWDDDGESVYELRFENGAPIDDAKDQTDGDEVVRLKKEVQNLVQTAEEMEQLRQALAQIGLLADGDLTVEVQLLRKLNDLLRQETGVIAEEDELDLSLLENASFNGNTKEVRRLLSTEDDPEAQTDGLLTTIAADQKEAFEVYVEHGVDVAQTFDIDEDDGTVCRSVNALICAAELGSLWAVKRMVELGVDPGYCSPDGETALHAAINAEEHEIAEYLENCLKENAD